MIDALVPRAEQPIAAMAAMLLLSVTWTIIRLGLQDARLNLQRTGLANWSGLDNDVYVTYVMVALDGTFCRVLHLYDMSLRGTLLTLGRESSPSLWRNVLARLAEARAENACSCRPCSLVVPALDALIAEIGGLHPDAVRDRSARRIQRAWRVCLRRGLRRETQRETQGEYQGSLFLLRVHPKTSGKAS